MEFILIGKVSALDGARWHFDVHGWAYCGAGRGRTRAETRWRVDGTVEPDRVCKRCLKALRRALGEAEDAGDGYAESAAFALAPDDPEWEARMLAEMRAHIIEANRPTPTPLELSGLDTHAYRRRLLAQLNASTDAEALFPLSLAA